MKKILCLILAVAMLFSFAACGGSESSEAESVADNTESTATGATSIKFAADTYEVKVGGYKMVSDGIVIEPAGAKVVYSSSDTDVVSISKKGEVNGLKEGTVTITAKSEDGSVSATCTVVVLGYGSIVARDEETKVGGITQKRYKAPEAPDDTNAIVVIISKNVDKAADKAIVTSFDFGARNEDGYYFKSGEGFYVTRNNDKGNYLLEDVPTGDYVGLIICSKDYTNYKTYDNSTIAANLKASALAGVLSDAEIDAIAARPEIQSREFVVKEFSVKAEETTVFGHDFRID